MTGSADRHNTGIARLRDMGRALWSLARLLDADPGNTYLRELVDAARADVTDLRAALADELTSELVTMLSRADLSRRGIRLLLTDTPQASDRLRDRSDGVVASDRSDRRVAQVVGVRTVVG